MSDKPVPPPVPKDDPFGVTIDQSTYDHLMYRIFRGPDLLFRYIFDGLHNRVVFHHNSRELPDDPSYADVIAKVLAAVAATDGRMRGVGVHANLSFARMKRRLLIAGAPLGLGVRLLSWYDDREAFVNDPAFLPNEPHDPELYKLRRARAYDAAFRTPHLEFGYPVISAMERVLDAVAVGAAVCGMTARMRQVREVDHVMISGQGKRALILPSPQRVILYAVKPFEVPGVLTDVLHRNDLTLQAVFVNDQEYPIIHEALTV